MMRRTFFGVLTGLAAAWIGGSKEKPKQEDYTFTCWLNCMPEIEVHQAFEESNGAKVYFSFERDVDGMVSMKRCHI